MKTRTATRRIAPPHRRPRGDGQTARAARPRRPSRVDSETISGLGARNIGSAAMSGRIAALDAVHEGDRLTIYVGAACGGVWKSINGGTTYKPVFDKQPVQSIGAVTIDPKNPKVVWVGTGESWTRNSVSIGDGIYKSVDGGENWTNIGLEELRADRQDPRRPDRRQHRVRLRARQALVSDSDERGVYKTTDGGKTWTKVLAGANLVDRLLDDLDGPRRIRRRSTPGCGTSAARAGRSAPAATARTRRAAAGCSRRTDGGATWTRARREVARRACPRSPGAASP